MSRYDDRHGGGSAGSMLLAFVAGAAAALLAGGYFLFGPQGRRNRARTERWIEDAREEISARMRGMADATRERYEGVVDEVLSRYAIAKQVTKNEAQRLRDRLSAEWEDVRREIEEARQEAKRGDRGV